MFIYIGKSTLCKILSNYTIPSSGTIEFQNENQNSQNFTNHKNFLGICPQV